MQGEMMKAPTERLLERLLRIYRTCLQFHWNQLVIKARLVPLQKLPMRMPKGFVTQS